MIPATVGGVIGFLVFIAPGVLFELLRERVRPPLEGSAFREASRVALMSVVLSGAAILILAILRAIFPSLLADPGAWLRDGDPYVDEEYARIAWTVGAELALACLLAWLPLRWPRLLDFLRYLEPAPSKSGAFNVAEPVVWSVLFGTAAGEPESTTEPAKLETRVLARHVDGFFYNGKFLAIDYARPRDEAFLALQRPIYIQRPGAAASEPMPRFYDRVILPLGELADVWIVREEPPPE